MPPNQDDFNFAEEEKRDLNWFITWEPPNWNVNVGRRHEVCDAGGLEAKKLVERGMETSKQFTLITSTLVCTHTFNASKPASRPMHDWLVKEEPISTQNGRSVFCD